ncbi:hypothetical protein CDL12_18086 [Handroanthus impetiginosus]|uniref:Uncharacterized protein n=1 Tax=Handroanthus impetiginosus TaxID=429701 RepID=A0A2G9GVM6_9LAMI|nr:hypothetical protein CDL12_18086 [Handroanthus impetiginosus]
MKYQASIPNYRQGSQQNMPQPAQEKKHPLEEMLMQQTKICQLVHGVNARPQGSLLRNIEINPRRDLKEQCPVIILRHGKKLEGKEVILIAKKMEVKTSVEKLHIKILFAKALEHMISHVKFMKEILYKKRALCDLVASKKVRFGDAKPTSVTLQLVDRSLGYPRGIIKDALIKVDKFIFQADFIILDIVVDNLAENVPLVEHVEDLFEKTKLSWVDEQVREVQIKSLESRPKEFEILRKKKTRKHKRKIMEIHV